MCILRRQEGPNFVWLTLKCASRIDIGQEILLHFQKSTFTLFKKTVGPGKKTYIHIINLDPTYISEFRFVWSFVGH